MTLLRLQTGNDGSLDYDAFLAEKVRFDRSYGFPVPAEAFSPIFQPGHPDFKPHQREIVGWAVAGGRRAIFARYGLGKSVMQLEVLRLIVHLAPVDVPVRRALIVAPLGVRFDIIRDGRKHLDMEVRFIRRTEEVDPEWSGIYVTNYESVRDGKLEAVRQGRRGFGSELNPVSVADSLVYLRRHDNEANTPTLFDLLDLEGTAA